jgi:hypothetical protein
MPDLTPDEILKKFETEGQTPIELDNQQSDPDSIINLFEENKDAVIQGKDYATEQYLDFGRKIEDVRKQARSIMEEVEGTEFITPNEKKERIDDIDIEINQLQQEQEKLAERRERISKIRSTGISTGFTAMRGVPSIEDRTIKDISKKISDLNKEKESLQEVIQPITNEELKEAESVGIGSGYKDADFFGKYGEDRGNKIYAQYLDNQYEKEAKINLKQKTPETILSYNNLTLNTLDSLKYATDEELDSIMNKVTETKDYNKSLYDKKRSLIASEVKKFVSGKEIEDKKSAEENILNHLLLKWIKTDDDAMNVEGYKLFAESQLDKINTMIDYYGQSYDQLNTKGLYEDGIFTKESPAVLSQMGLIPVSNKERLQKEFGNNNIDTYEKTLIKDLKDLNNAKKYYESILKLPETKRGVRDLGKAASSLKLDDFALGIPDMAEAVNITGIMKKLENGKELTFGEKMLFEGFSTQQFSANYDTQGKWYKIFRGAALMAPYVAEFAMTGGIYTATKAATIKAVKPVTRKAFTQAFGKRAMKAADITATNIGRISGTAARTLALPQLYIKNTAENIRPDVVLDPKMEEISFKVLENTGDPLVKGAIKGTASTFVEMAFEQSGQYLMKGLSAIPKFAGKKLPGKELLKRKVLDDFMKMKGIKKISELNDYIVKKNLGWDGIAEEYLEELGTYFTEKAIQGEKFIDKNFWEDQLVTLGTIAVFGGALKPVKVATTYMAGRDRVFEVTDSKTGEDKKIRVPADMYNDFYTVLSEGEELINHDEYQKFLDKWGDKMNKDQFDLLFTLTVNEGTDRLAKTAQKKGAKVSEKAVTEEPVEPQITDDERKEIVETNKRIIKEHPDLAVNNLLRTDEGGQYIEPTKETIDDQYQEVSANLAEKAEFDNKGNIINVTPEVEELVQQKEVLENYMDRFRGVDVPFAQLSVADKQKQIVSEMKKEGKEKEGKIVYYPGTDTRFGIKLKDGRTVDAFIDKSLSKEEKKKVEKAIIDQEDIKLNLQSWEEWNPDLSITDPRGVPYYDRIQVFHKNKPIGFVQVVDYKQLGREQEKVEKEAKQVVSDVTQKATDIFSKMKVEKPTEEEPDIEVKKTDIEKKKEKELDKLFEGPYGWSGWKRNESLLKSKDYLILSRQLPSSTETAKELIEKYHKINAKYDAELAALKKQPLPPTDIVELAAGKDFTGTEEYNEFSDYMTNFISNNNIEYNREYSYQEALKLIKFSESKLLSPISKVFENTLNRLNTRVVFTESSENTAVAYYNYATNVIVLPVSNMSNGYVVRKRGPYSNQPQFNPKAMLQTTFMHESIHAFTSLKIAISEDTLPEETKDVQPELTKNEQEAIFSLNSLFEYVNENYPNKVKPYGLKNTQEFVAEAFSEPLFMRELANMEVPVEVYETTNAFTAFVRYIMQLLGINKKNNTAFNAITEIADTFAKEYDPQMAADFRNEYLAYLDLTNGLPPTNVYLDDQITPDNQKTILNNFIESLNDVDWNKIEIADAIDLIKQGIDNAADLSDTDKGFMKAFVDDNTNKIIDNISKQKLKAAGLAKKAERLSLDELIIPELEGIALSGTQKVDAFLKGFSPVWRTIADNINTTKENVENIFYKIAKTPDVNSNLQNESVYHEFLNSIEGKDNITDEIIKVLRRSPLSSSVSLFDFYSNLHLTKQYGTLYNNGRFVFRLLNPSQRYDEFVDNFRTRIREYSIPGYKGYEALKRRITRHNTEREKRFNSKNQNWQWYDSQTPEERERLRREQHEEDLLLLSEITGISTGTWRQYFNEKTKETYAHASKDTKVLSNYVTYDNLLKNDVFRNGRRRIQSNLAFQLGFGTIYNKKEGRPRTTKEFADAFNKFFLQGNENVGTLSNLYKLSTSISDKDEIGQSGVDIKSDRFSSFIQSSNITDIASKIRSSSVDNHIVSYYRDIDEDMDIIMLNGIHNLSLNKDKKGTQSLNMSNEDLWMAQLALFLEEGDSYFHWTGQFGDKPSLPLVKVPKLPLDEGLIKSEYKDFDDIVKWFNEEILIFNQDKLQSIYKGVSFTERKPLRNKIAREFIFNFMTNIKATNEIFFGKEDSYSDFTDMVKRAGSSNSPGYRLNTYIEGGVGETYQFAIVNDEFENFEQFDGVEFMSGEYAEKTQVSMGDVFNKKSEEGYEVLDSTKALTSFIDPETGLRGLTKTNRLNVDILANSLPKGNKYEQVRNFMRENEIDVLSFTSGTKKYEKTKNRYSVAVKLWDNNGNLIKKPNIPNNSIIPRNNSDVYIQQDLRHSTVPKTTKMPSQLLANALMLDHGADISNMINKLQTTLINEFIQELDKGRLDEAKLAWLKEEVNEDTQPDLYRLLEMGITPYEPSFANFMRKIISGTLTKRTLDIPINKVTTQEIPDADGILEGRREYEGHILLPDIAANINGARYENDEYKGKPEKAIEFVIGNKRLHQDLFDLDGNLMEWIIRGRDGIIPGEPTISTRVPADDLHSHTVGRLKYKIETGNFTMLDRDSREASGSDFDGDQRFNQVFYKKKGSVYFDDTKEGIANQMMMQIVMDYTDPNFDSKIKTAINTNAYDHIVDKYRKDEIKYSNNDPRAYAKARDENMVGVKMKGILTDAVTIYSLVNGRNIDFKKKIILPIKVDEKTTKHIELTGIKRDSKGFLKDNLDNLLNMAFDNAKDPKIEIMGLNEITSNMFIIALIGNNNLNISDNKAIIKYIEDVVRYFNSPILKRFTSLMRRDNGGLRRADIKNVEKILEKEFGSSQTKHLINFYLSSNEFPKLRRFYSLTQRASGSVVEFYTDESLYSSVKNNSSNDFKFINVKNLFNDFGNPVTEFAVSEDVIALSKRYIFSDSFNYSEAGQQIMSVIIDMFDKKRFFTKDEISSIDYGLNNIGAIRALGVKKSASTIERQLIDNMDKYKEKFPDNSFIQTIEKVFRKGKYYIEIAPDYRRAKISDEKLAEIRSDFDRLWSSEDKNIAEDFVAHTIFQRGATNSTFGGGYYNLVGDKFKVHYSARVQNEIRKWQLNEISSLEKLQITEWILRNSKLDGFNKKATNPSQANYYDYNSLAILDTPLSYESFDNLTGVSSVNEFLEFAKEHDFSAEALRDELSKIYGRPLKSLSKDILPAVESLFKEYQNRANILFPNPTNTGIQPKNMLSSDAVGEALSTEDQSLQDFVYGRIKKMYPTVEIMKDRESFMNFVKKWGDKGININQEAIGHAFANIIFIDENKAVQSSIYHELSHIYWDALPDNDKTKQNLRNLFKETYPNHNQSDLDEEIILEIGRAGISMANVQMRGTRLDRFIEYLKNLWRTIKSKFGIYSKMDLVQNLTWDIWYNSDKIVPDTNYGNAVVRNMISYNFKKDEVPGFNGETHTHTIGGLPIPSTTTIIKLFQSEGFDPEIKAKASAMKQAKMYYGITREKWSEEERRREGEGLYQLWSEDVQEKGTEIHDVGEAVFKDTPTDPSIISDHFESRDVFLKTRNIFKGIKKHLLELYPDAIFYSEPHLISKKFQIGGFADLVVDIGNNELILIDFKTTNEEYADDTMKPLKSYKKSFGNYKAPFQNLAKSKYSQHMLQLNMYANTLEEQGNPNNPGKKNKVLKTRVIPIIRELKNGKITSVKEGNWVNIPRNEKTEEISKNMMKLSYLQRQNVNKIYPKFRKNLEEQRMAPSVIDDMLKAFHFMNIYTGDIKRITKDHIGDMRHEGIQNLHARLLASIESGGLGYDIKDLHGPNALTSEELFFISHNMISKDQYLGYTDSEGKEHTPLKEKFFKEQLVYSHFKPIRNPKEVKKRWSRYGNTLLHEVSIRRLKENDELMMIYEIPRKSGRTPVEIYYYTVIDKDTKRNRIKVLNQETGNEDWITPPSKNDGLYKVETDLPEDVTEPGKNSFVPRYIYEAEEKKEFHWNIPFEHDDDGTQESELEISMKEKEVRKVWNFFNRYKTWNEFVNFFDDERKVLELYEGFNTVDNKISEPLVLLTRHETVNHWMSGLVKRENSEYDEIPPHILPMTLNLYYILTNHNNAVWNDFDRARPLRSNMTPRMMENKYTPLNTFTLDTETEYKKYIQESFDLNEKFKKYRDKINYDVVLRQLKNGRTYWKKPSLINRSQYPLERDFLETVYKYYTNFDPATRDAANDNIVREIEVSSIWASLPEFIERFGRKYGRLMHDKLRPAPYDSIKLPEITGFKNGEPVYAEDRDGNKIIRTLGQMKENFVFDTSKTDEMEKFLGPKWRHMVLRVPGTVRVAGSTRSGILNYQIKKAEKIYDSGSDNNNLNLRDIINKNKKKIPVVGRGGLTEYSTSLLVEAEEKTIDSMIFAHYMKRLMAPLDWMVSQYESGTSSESIGPAKSITSWIKAWGDYQLYRRKPEGQEHLFLPGRKMSDVIDFGNRMNSLNKIMFSPMTQVNNIAIGQTLDIVREPAAYSKGWKRLFENGDFTTNAKKAYNILKRYGLANIVSDTVFDQIDKEYRLFGMDLSKIENYGYAPMDIAEKLNQFPVFIGLMTDDEWNAYNKEGYIIDKSKKKHLTSYRRTVIERRVKDIHGDYGGINTAPFWISNIGKAVMPFRKWLPAMIWSHIAPYHIDSNYAVRSGLLPTLDLSLKILTYNRKTTEETQKKRAKEIKEMVEKGEMNNEAFFNTTKEYFNTLKKSVNGGKITWKDLSDNDKRNIVSLGLELTIAGINMLIATSILGGDDKEKYEPFGKRLFTTMFNRFQGDVFFVYGFDNWEYFFQNFIPSASLVFAMSDFMIDFSKWVSSMVKPDLAKEALYNQDELLAIQGTPRFLIDATYILPAGSALRWLQKRKRIFTMKHSYVDLREFNLTDEDLKRIGLTNYQISEFDILENSLKWDKIYRDLMLSEEYYGLELNGVNPSTYLDLQLGEKLKRQEADKIQQALQMITLQRMLDQGELDTDVDKIMEGAKKMRNLKKSKSPQKKKEIEEKYEEAKETYKR